MNDHDLAAMLAEQAGQLLLSIRDLGGDEGDRRSNEFLLAALAEHRPADSVLSEESVDDLARLASDRVWIIDPLDGTREYGEPPRDDWAVHVALTVAGVPVAGAVALPGRNMVLNTGAPASLAPTHHGPPRMVVSRTRPPACTDQLAVVLGDADVYAHSGGQYEWDSCAPVAVAAAAGLHVSRLDGSPLVYNQPDPYMPDLLICRVELVNAVLTALRMGP